MNNNHIHPEDKFLTSYCHYPIFWAKNNYGSSRKHRYRITTVDWTYATDRQTGRTNFDYVHKKIYEMNLQEFKNWSAGLHNEDIISIEKITA